MPDWLDVDRFRDVLRMGNVGSTQCVCTGTRRCQLPGIMIAGASAAELQLAGEAVLPGHLGLAVGVRQQSGTEAANMTQRCNPSACCTAGRCCHNPPAAQRQEMHTNYQIRRTSDHGGAGWTTHAGAAAGTGTLVWP